MSSEFSDVFIPILGLSYLMAVVIQPAIVVNADLFISAMLLLVMFLVITINYFYINSKPLWYMLCLISIYIAVSSWAGMIVWNTPYSQETTSLTMSVLNLASSIFFYSKAMNTEEE